MNARERFSGVVLNVDASVRFEPTANSYNKVIDWAESFNVTRDLEDEMRRRGPYQP